MKEKKRRVAISSVYGRLTKEEDALNEKGGAAFMRAITSINATPKGKMVVGLGKKDKKT